VIIAITEGWKEDELSADIGAMGSRERLRGGAAPSVEKLHPSM
jgi:hypothetical protein